MAYKVILPKQGLQMTEGVIRKWLKSEGEKCIEGQPLFEMETDKLNITIDSPATGQLLKILHHEGDVVPITELIGIIGEDGEDISDILVEPKAHQKVNYNEVMVDTGEEIKDNFVSREKDDKRIFSTPRARMKAEEKNIDILSVVASGPEGLIIERDIQSFILQKATPLAKKVAKINDIDIKEIIGSGSRGKVTRDDIIAAVEASKKEHKGIREEKLVPMSGMRKIIADKMIKSQQVHAQLSHQIEVNMANATKLRETFASDGKKVSINDIILHASCRAIKEYPMINSEVTEQGIVVKEYVNLGIAVGLEDGLIVPNIKDADLMCLEEISIYAKKLAKKAKNNTLSLGDYRGGTFTVSNLGMYGLNAFTAIINTPESGILAVGKIENKPVIVDTDIVIQPMVTLTLTYDHRVLDGVPAAQFLKRIKEYLENPYLML